MQRRFRAATQSGQGPFKGPGSVAHSALYPESLPSPPCNSTVDDVIDFECHGRFYGFRFEGGYGRGQWCLEDHTENGIFTKADAQTALNFDAVNRLGLEIGPVDWYGVMTANTSYQVTYDGSMRLRLEELGPCESSSACTAWQNPHPTQGEIDSGFRYPSYQELSQELAPRAQFTGTWCNFSQVNNSDYPQCPKLGKASVFGGGGSLRINTTDTKLQIPKILDIELMNRTLPLYGASLVPHGSPLPAPTLDLSLVSYAISEAFQEKWVYSETGPGMFLEHHLFTHYFMNPAANVYPAQNGTQTSLISLARQVNASQDCQATPCDYWITAFSVPSGYTIFCPPGCIHEDWTYQDKVVTTLADWKHENIINDNTVYLRNENMKKIELVFYTTGNNRMAVGEDDSVVRGVTSKETNGISGAVEYARVR